MASAPEQETFGALTGQTGDVGTALLGGPQTCPPCAEQQPCPQQQRVDSSLFGTASDAATLASKNYACNSEKAMEDLTAIYRKVADIEGNMATRRNRGDKDRQASLHQKLIRTTDDYKSFRFCVESMMPDLLKLWDQKKADGSLKDLWSQADDNIRGMARGKSEISQETLRQTALGLDPTANAESAQAQKMQSGLKVMMDKLAGGSGGQLSTDQLQQLKYLHEQLGNHLNTQQQAPIYG